MWGNFGQKIFKIIEKSHIHILEVHLLPILSRSGYRFWLSWKNDNFCDDQREYTYFCPHNWKSKDHKYFLLGLLCVAINCPFSFQVNPLSVMSIFILIIWIYPQLQFPTKTDPYPDSLHWFKEIHLKLPFNRNGTEWPK